MRVRERFFFQTLNVLNVFSLMFFSGQNLNWIELDFPLIADKNVVDVHLFGSDFNFHLLIKLKRTLKVGDALANTF